MKKIYLLGISALLATASMAQTAKKANLHINNGGRNVSKTVSVSGTNAKKHIGGPNNVQQVNGGITCDTYYSANNTMDLVFTFALSMDSAFEWIDSMAITFPTGITPNVTGTTDPFPVADGGSTGQDPAAPLAINGQVVSWGTDTDSEWGAIESLNPGVAPYTFTVNVTVDPGVTGPQMANFFASSDQYDADTTDSYVPGDYSGIINIYEQPNVNVKAVGTLLVDAAQLAGGTVSVLQSACGLGQGILLVIFKNDGLDTIVVGQTGDNINYSVNGVPSTVAANDGTTTQMVAYPTFATITSLLPGDTAMVVIGVPIDLSTPGDYTVSASLDFAGSGDEIPTDNTIVPDLTITDIGAVDLSTTIYTNSFETNADFVNNLAIYSTNGGWSYATNPGQFHSGAQGLQFNPAAADIGWINTYCMDVTANDIYKVKYWTKLSANNASTGVSIMYSNVSNTATDMSAGTEIKPFVASTNVWKADSTLFTATATETVYFGFKCTVASAPTMFIDDISIQKVGTVGIKENAAASEAISVFPNPSNGTFTIRAIENNSSVEVFSIIGENVYSSSLAKGNNNVELSNLAAGTYIVKVKAGNETITKRIVINK
jgi:hypothetical protein